LVELSSSFVLLSAVGVEREVVVDGFEADPKILGDLRGGY